MLIAWIKKCLEDYQGTLWWSLRDFSREDYFKGYMGPDAGTTYHAKAGGGGQDVEIELA